MDTGKVIQDLNRRFAASLPEFYQRRIIFWYDEDKEFEDKLEKTRSGVSPRSKPPPACGFSDFLRGTQKILAG